jgi:hypothetical protein
MNQAVRKEKGERSKRSPLPPLKKVVSNLSQTKKRGLNENRQLIDNKDGGAATRTPDLGVMNPSL